jgi:hypothetical protein
MVDVLVPHCHEVHRTSESCFDEQVTLFFRDKYKGGLLRSVADRDNATGLEKLGFSNVDEDRPYVCAACQRTPASDEETRDKEKWTCLPGEKIKRLCPCCGVVEDIVGHHKRKCKVIFR